ncbi:hypothetical protein SZ64_04430 [Erythrobacter sp. SG61-1L]|uniref:hypothetical protein n=1 Tax=Erythrobacter sp. SG61-1L TaxID=1603897 RepID=UPI0006C922D6|nr:hypothetical protein [Erythrobacter sp. SG61-1L]KPL67416.1 hypothetical protein SZ64_04430 [Erythrobacter sp. SG61-1L]
MSKPRFGGLGGVMRGQAEMPRAQMRDPDGMPEGEPGEDPDDLEDDDEEEANGSCKKKDTNMKDQEQQAAAPAGTVTAEAMADAVSKARAEERQRVTDVFASEHVKGREMAAAELIGNSDMKAEAIVAMLPKLTPAASADEGQQMLSQMREGGNPDTGDAPGSGEPVAQENHGWSKAVAKAAKLAGRK